jgi:hypothetical protein
MGCTNEYVVVIKLAKSDVFCVILYMNIPPNNPQNLTETQLNRLVEKLSETALMLGVPISIAIISNHDLVKKQLPIGIIQSCIQPANMASSNGFGSNISSQSIELIELPFDSSFITQKRIGFNSDRGISLPTERSPMVARKKALTVHDEKRPSGVADQARANALTGVASDYFTNLYGGVPLMISNDDCVDQVGSLGVSGGSQIEDLVIGLLSALKAGFTFTDTQLDTLFESFTKSQRIEALYLISKVVPDTDIERNLQLAFEKSTRSLLDALLTRRIAIWVRKTLQKNIANPLYN